MQLVTVSEIKAFLEKTDTSSDTLLDTLDTQTSEEIQNLIGYHLEYAERTEYYNTEKYKCIIYFIGFPVLSVSKVYYDSSRVFDESTLLTTDYYYADNYGIKFYGNFTSNAKRVLKVIYKSGWYLSGVNKNLPNDLRKVCIRQTAMNYLKRREMGIIETSKTSLTTTVTVAYDPEAMEIINKYKSKAIVI